MILPLKPFLLCALVMALSITACDTEPDTFEATGDESYFVPSGASVIQYQVDSTIFDPSVGGTAKITSSSIWSLQPDAASEGRNLFVVAVQGLDSGSIERQRYLWDFQSDGPTGGRHISQLDGISYVSLVTPFTPNTVWDGLLVADPDLEITVAGEPLEIHKSWTNARIDSIGLYPLPDGTSVEAVWVSLTDAENAIELRSFSEVYGKGLGLLERTQRFLDTQQAASTEPWEEKAENGFIVNMKRIF